MADDIKDQFKTQLRQLEVSAAKSTNSCLVAQYIALTDKRVETLFFKKIADKHVFNGISCLSGIGIPEYKRVHFDFDCPSGTICLIKPAFLVVVNIVDGTVVSIIDPYIPGADAVAARGVSDQTAAAASKEATGGGHIVTFGEVHFDDAKAITITNDSGDFTVEYYDVQKKFTLKFERDISRTVLSLTPFFSYVGDDPYLSVHAARHGPKELGVVLSANGSAFARKGCGFWIMVVYLKMCA